ncbi:MAG: Uma2 family endonuclease [Burkholderiales bacterium]
MTDLSQPAPPVALRKHRLTVEDYHKLGEAGVLNEDSRVELFEGELVDMAPIGDFHASVVDQLGQVLVRASGDLIVRIQNPVRFDGHTELQPDLALLKAQPNFYRYAAPTPADVLLLIEVADSTVKEDREVKIPYYAGHNIPEVWLVNIPEEVVEVFSRPASDGYRQARRYGAGDVLVFSPLQDLRIEISSLF